MGHKTVAAAGGAKAADGKAKLKGNPTGGNKKPAPKAKPAGGNGTPPPEAQPAGGNGTPPPPPPPEAQPAGGDGTLKPKAVGGGDGKAKIKVKRKMKILVGGEKVAEEKVEGGKAKPAGGNGTPPPPPPPEAQPAGGDGTLKPKAVGGGDGKAKVKVKRKMEILVGGEKVAEEKVEGGKAKPAGGNGTPKPPPPPEAQPAGGDGTLKPKAVGGGDGEAKIKVKSKMESLVGGGKVAEEKVEGGGAAGKAEGQYAVAKTSVWWDIENCAVPKGSDPHVVARSISSGLVAMGYKGAVTITAYGDTSIIRRAVQQALSSTGISLNHVPPGVKDASDKRILVDMLFWAVDNPPPANYLLISGDRDFSNALHQLRLRRYNILLAHLPNVSQALVAAANCVWCWTNLLEGGPPLPKQSTHVKSSTFPIEKKVTNQSLPLPLNQTSPIAKKVLNKKPISLPLSRTFPCHKVLFPHGKVSILSLNKKMTTSKRKTKNSTGNLGILPLKKKVRRRKKKPLSDLSI